jgi:hypothetical protein
MFEPLRAETSITSLPGYSREIASRNKVMRFASIKSDLLITTRSASLNLLPIDVEDLLRKTAARLQTKNPKSPDGIHKHAYRRHGEVVPIQPTKRIGDRRSQIGAAAHRLGNENVGSGAFPSAFVRPSTRELNRQQKQPPGISLRCKAMGTQHRRIHQIAPLIVRDQSDTLSKVTQMPRKPPHRSGLTRTQKAPQHDVPRLGRRRPLRVGRM